MSLYRQKIQFPSSPTKTTTIFSKASNLSEDHEKYKLLKAGTVLHTLPTEQSCDLSVSQPLGLEHQSTDKKTFAPNTLSPSYTKANNSIDRYSDLARPQTSRHVSRYSAGPSSSWIKETLAQYLPNSQKNKLVPNIYSPQARDTPEKLPEKLVSNMRKKNLSISSPSTDLFNGFEKSPLLQPKSDTHKSNPKDRILLFNGSTGFQKSSSNSTRPASTRNYQSSTPKRVDPIIISSRDEASYSKHSPSSAEKRLLVGSAGLNRHAATDRGPERDNIRKMSREIEEKEHRTSGAKAKDQDMEKRFQAFMKENEEARSTIGFLQEEVVTLKSIVLKYQDENSKLKESKSKLSHLTIEPVASTEQEHKVGQGGVEELLEENKNIKKNMESIKEENEQLRKVLGDMKKFQHQSEYYKSLYESKVKECSTLAEQIIGLRVELDRSHSRYLKIMKNQGKIEEGSSPPVGRGSSLKRESERNHSAKKGVTWKDELEEQAQGFKE